MRSTNLGGSDPQVADDSAPAQEGPGLDGALAGAPVAACQAMKSLLIVDDEVEIVKALRRLLRHDFKVEVAHTGAEALSRLEQGSIDVVLSDFRMPGMNGAELLAQVKARWPATARAMLSGYADLDSTNVPVAEGQITRFIRKPWDDEELRETLRTLLAEVAGSESGP